MKGEVPDDRPAAMKKQPEQSVPLVVLIFKALSVLTGVMGMWLLMEAFLADPSDLAEELAAARKMWAGWGLIGSGLTIWWMAVVVELLARISGGPAGGVGNLTESDRQRKLAEAARRTFGK